MALKKSFVGLFPYLCITMEPGFCNQFILNVRDFYYLGVFPFKLYDKSVNERNFLKIINL